MSGRISEDIYSLKQSFVCDLLVIEAGNEQFQIMGLHDYYF